MTLRAKTSKTPRARRETPKETPNLAPSGSGVRGVYHTCGKSRGGHRRHQTTSPRLLSPPRDSPISRLNAARLLVRVFHEKQPFFFFFSFVPASSSATKLSSDRYKIFQIRTSGEACESACFPFSVRRARLLILANEKFDERKNSFR